MKIEKIKNLLEAGFPDVKFVVEHDDSRPIVRWTNGPGTDEVYDAASLIGIRKSELICFKTEIIAEENSSWNKE
ncbi:hypothetical protein EHV15_34225 [Paenibacillus oralis]|uniref:Uncharacterized protein n=1 Tax=Paenibacillus oralis TaxID=2490856 RepID=A0A3P3T9F6_9BACL|nr:hypothetical protein [Paenibacillus oralis]RRJ54656.1 hypothetical protein EHV15_34225 [Paenibacillus oralis]